MRIELSEMMRLKGRIADLNDELGRTFGSIRNDISSIGNNILSSPLSKPNLEFSNKIASVSGTLETTMNQLMEFFDSQINQYQVTNEEAEAELVKLVNTISTTFAAEGVTEYTSKAIYNSAASIDTSVYKSNPDNGFVVTTGNATYQVSDQQRDTLYAIVAAESDKSYDDALGVASVIMNRCEDSWCANTFGANPYNQATAKGQFSVYSGGNGVYTRYTGGNAPETVRKAVDDALNGVRNCEYLYFRSNGSSYSNNMITSSGNRYK